MRGPPSLRPQRCEGLQPNDLDRLSQQRFAGGTAGIGTDRPSQADATGVLRRLAASSLRAHHRSTWRPGPVQQWPVNRVRAGRQQLSADAAVCRRLPGRLVGR